MCTGHSSRHRSAYYWVQTGSRDVIVSSRECACEHHTRRPAENVYDPREGHGKRLSVITRCVAYGHICAPSAAYTYLMCTICMAVQCPKIGTVLCHSASALTTPRRGSIAAGRWASGQCAIIMAMLLFVRGIRAAECVYVAYMILLCVFRAEYVCSEV